MSTLAQLEDSIQALPNSEFMQLAEWVSLRHLNLLDNDGYESSDLEAELLKGLDGPRYTVDDAFVHALRSRFDS